MIPSDLDLSFKPRVQVIQSFVPCEDSLVSSTRNAKRKDHQINNLFFFAVIGVVRSLLQHLKNWKII